LRRGANRTVRETEGEEEEWRGPDLDSDFVVTQNVDEGVLYG
jgi:hypothetical protein